MSSVTIGIIGIVLLLILIFKGMNIGLSMLFIGFVGTIVILNPTAGFVQLRTDPATTASTFSLMVVPLFILMGNFAFHAGLSEGLYDCANKWLSRLPGSLACATIAACAGFGAICGSNAATCATMGTISLPEMRKYGYDDKISTGSVAIGGTLGILIPPSTPMIIYAIMAEASIGRIFIAGILPGIMMSILCIVTIVIIVRLRPSYAPKGSKYPWKERLSSLKGLIGVAILFGVVLGGMFSGFFSVNQSAAVGAFLAFVMMVINMLIKSELNWTSFLSKFKDAMWNSITTFSMTFLMIIGASLFGKFLTISTLPMAIANNIGNLDISPNLVILLMFFVYIILGMVMDELPMIMLTVPIFLPIVSRLGFDLIWFGIFIIFTMKMGALTPPVGLNCFIISGVAKDIPLGTIYKGVIPFTLTIIVGVILILLFPQIVLLLPNLMM